MHLIELVPRDLEILLTEAEGILESYPQITAVNIPDVLRLDVRSYDAAKVLLEKGIDAIPHIRTTDNPIEKTIEIIESLIPSGLKRVLLVTGDSPVDLNKPTYPISPVMVVEKLKRRCPDLLVYCALDPYRQSFQQELNYCHEKLRAGADGFFTQPFFDVDLARIYIEQLEAYELFIGLSPVITESSKNYWITRNKVIFPSQFHLELADQCELSKDLIQLAIRYHKHTYMMPIRVDVGDYLEGVF